MQLEHEFALPISADRAWAALLDLERVAPCMPGATLDRVDGDTFAGRVTLKVGPLRLSYRGDGRIEEKDDAARRMVIVAAGREAKGSGSAEATVTAHLEDAGHSTRVRLRTDLALTGRAAQFGRGLVGEVSDGLLTQFAERLSYELQNGHRPEPALEPLPAPAAPAAAEPIGAAATARDRVVPDEGVTTAEENALDVLALARAALGNRGAALAGAAAALLLGFLVGRRSRGARSMPWPAVVVVEAGRG